MHRTFSLYAPLGVGTARQLRREATFPERLLWSRLRMGGIGTRVLRQHPIGPYIVDFCAPDEGVVIEVDGRSNDGTAARDAARHAWLESQEWRVVRVTNDDVLTDLDGVVDRISAALGRVAPGPGTGSVVSGPLHTPTPPAAGSPLKGAVWG